jgi:hypothetical protein
MAHAVPLIDAALPGPIDFWLANRRAAGAVANGEHAFAAAIGVATPDRGSGRPKQSDAGRLNAAGPLAGASRAGMISAKGRSGPRRNHG